MLNSCCQYSCLVQILPPHRRLQPCDARDFGACNLLSNQGSPWQAVAEAEMWGVSCFLHVIARVHVDYDMVHCHVTDVKCDEHIDMCFTVH